MAASSEFLSIPWPFLLAAFSLLSFMGAHLMICAIWFPTALSRHWKEAGRATGRLNRDDVSSRIKAFLAGFFFATVACVLILAHYLKWKW